MALAPGGKDEDLYRAIGFPTKGDQQEFHAVNAAGYA